LQKWPLIGTEGRLFEPSQRWFFQREWDYCIREVTKKYSAKLGRSSYSRENMSLAGPEQMR